MTDNDIIVKTLDLWALKTVSDLYDEYGDHKEHLSKEWIEKNRKLAHRAQILRDEFKS